MKVTHPIDVFLADKLFQLTSSSVPGGQPRGVPRALAGRRGRVRRQLRHRRRHRRAGRRVRRDRRHVQPVHHRHPRRAPRRPGGLAEQAIARHGRIDYVVDTAGVLPRGPRSRPSEETIEAATEVNYLAPVLIAQACYPHLHQTRAACCCSPRAPTPAAAPATASTPRPRPPSSTSPRPSPTSGPPSGSGSTASTPSAPAPRCAPRPSAPSRPSSLLVQVGGADLDRRAGVRPDRARDRPPQSTRSRIRWTPWSH